MAYTVPTRNSLNNVNSILCQEACKFITHCAWFWENEISLKFQMKRKEYLKTPPQKYKQKMDQSNLSLFFTKWFSSYFFVP